MKKFLLPLLFLIIPQILFSQVSNADLRSNVKEIRMQENTGMPAYMSFRDGYNLTHEQALEYSKSFCTAEDVGFTLKNQQTSKDGKQLYRYVQTIAGYPVEFSAWHVHEKNGKITALNGDIVDVTGLEMLFSISESEAFQAALNHIGAEFYMWMDAGEEQHLKSFLNDDDATYYPTGIKVITPIQPDIRIGEFRTAYKFDIYSKKPHDRKMVYVDAQTGEILFDLPLIHFGDEIGTANTAYSGEREINTYHNGTQYVLHDNTRGNGIKTYDLHRETNYNAKTDFFDDDNYWDNANEYLDEYATDAHFATMSTYDYYWNVHDRNSIDGSGFSLLSYVHYDYNYVNAFWNGYWMTYGDGNISQGYYPLTTIDICGHEITHGLTNFTADLIYAYEPGALNESFSDIFGTAIEFYATPEDASWLLGEKTGMIVRSLSNPKAYGSPDTYKGQFWVFGGQDSGGVHTNSGVLNYWFYLISEGGSGTNDNGHAYQVEAIGIEKAEQIAFKTLTEYLTPNSQYIDAFYYMVLAAYELFGESNPEVVQSVGDAFYATGVITDPFNSNVNFKASATSIKEETTVHFTDMSLSAPTAWHWYFEGGTPPESFAQNPSVLYEIPGNFDVKLVVTHSQGSDSLLRQNFIKVIPSPPIADFTADKTEIEAGDTISFINLSDHYPESYSWYFEGGTPTQTTQENPVIRFPKAGTYSVRLKTTNAGGSSTETKKDYIIVAPKTAIAEQGIDAKILIYPNPTDGEIQVTSYELQVTSIEIFDVFGRNAGVKFPSFGGVRGGNISPLPAGIYFIQITTEEGIVTKKIVKQ